MPGLAPEMQEDCTASARHHGIEVLIGDRAGIIKAVAPGHAIRRVIMRMQNGPIVGRIVRVFGPSGTRSQWKTGQTRDRGAAAIRPVVEP